jgi:subtilase family serine protease
VFTNRLVFHPNGPGQPFQFSAPVGLTPAQISRAYGIDQISFLGGAIAGDGRGQTIAIIDAFDNTQFVSSTSPGFNLSDLHQFDLAFNLPDPPSFLKLAGDGSTNYPIADPTGGEFAGETALDVEWAHALAPRANIVLLEADVSGGFFLGDDNLFKQELLSAVNTARRLPGVTAVTISFGFPEDANDPSLDSTFTTPAGHQGITFLASSGDDGANFQIDPFSGALVFQPVEFPALSPNVVGVGGTTLTVDAQGNYLNEIGWGNGQFSNRAFGLGGSGGGFSQFEAKPFYQFAVTTPSTTQRTVPDVAFDADPASGVAVYDSFSNPRETPWAEIGGTSFSSPAWAAIIAIADQGRALNGVGSLDGPTQTLPMLYQLPASDFHDITTGNNGFQAGPGYDLITGRGSPIAQLIVAGLAGTPVSTAATISGETFNDLNGNGVLDPGEPPLPGVTVQLTNLDTGAVTLTTSNAYGI